MCLKQLRKNFIVWLLIISVLFVYIEQPVKVYAEPVTLAGAWGGTAIAKEVLAMVIALYGSGVTLSTNESALDLYNELKVSNPNLLSDIISVQPQIWQGAVSEISQDMQGIKSGISNWFSGLFGGTTAGIVTSGETISADIVPNYYSNTFNINTPNLTGVPIDQKITTPLQAVIYRGYLWELNLISWNFTANDTKHEIKLTNVDWNISYTMSVIMVAMGEISTMVASIETTYNNINGKSVVNEGSRTDPIIGSPGMSATIAVDSPLNNPEWTVENDDKFPMPPLWLPNKAGDLPLKQSISAEGIEQTIYDGSIDDYTNDIVNNATWDDVWGYTQGVGSTATLTPTAEGLLVEDVGVGTGAIPYPEVGTTIPTDTLTGLGAITGLLQSIINWIYQLMQSIANLFIISDGYLVDKLGGLRTSLESKFDHTGWLGLLSGLGDISPEGIPDLEYKGSIILDGDIPNSIATNIKAWLRGILWILIVLYNLNQLYKLIRGTDYVWDRGRSGQ